MTENQQIRDHIKGLRRALTNLEQRCAAESVTDKLIKHDKIRAAEHIALFFSIDGEIDTNLLIQQLWQRGKSISLPALHPFSPGDLLFLRYLPSDKLKLNRLKIPEPIMDVRRVVPTQMLQVVITPLVAFDNSGHRLGMGGGYYDRLLQDWHKKNIYPIGIAHDCQRVEHLHVQPWDVVLPEIITPSNVVVS